MDEQQRRAHEIAAQIALAELLRTVIAEVFFTADREEFRKRLAHIEALSIDGLARRKLWPKANEETEKYVKAAAEGWISTIIGSILHPDDASNAGT